METTASTILLVEDEEPIRDLMLAALRRSGYRVLAAENGTDASALWEEERASIDLLLADILVPGLSGSDLALLFRSTRPDLKIIFMSGNPKEAVFETAHLVKGSRFLLKPFPIAKLLTIVADQMVAPSPLR